jgi:uncharacterized protein YbjT (DUF2867 family)
MKIHVTGGSGFLGGHVLRLLAERGYQVTALARSPAAARRVEALDAQAISGDLDDPDSMDRAFSVAAPDALLNLASLGFGHAPTIVAAAEDAGVKRAVFLSTTSLFTRLNAKSKTVRQAAEDVIRASALDWTILRPTMIYGTSGDRNVARLVRAVSRWPAFPLPGGGRGLHQPVHVDDVASAAVAALECPAAVRQSYDIAGPEAIEMRKMIDEVADAVGRRPVLISVPLGPLAAVVRVYEAIVPNPRLRAEQIARLGEDKAFDIGPAARDLAYQPRTFTQGIREEVRALDQSRS